ncbi:hypothetical protein CEXT_12851, partial [Caerostris extrusa]
RGRLLYLSLEMPKFKSRGKATQFEIKIIETRPRFVELEPHLHLQKWKCNGPSMDHH